MNIAPFESRRKHLFTSVVIVVLLGSCQRYVDSVKLKTQISEEFPQRTGLEVTSVQCPEQQPIKVNAAFTCRVTLVDEQSLDVQVRQQDDQGTMTWDAQTGLEGLAGIIDNVRLAQNITDGIFAQTQIRVETDCGTPLRLAQQGEEFVCTTIDEQRNRRDIQVTVENNTGKVSWGL